MKEWIYSGLNHIFAHFSHFSGIFGNNIKESHVLYIQQWLGPLEQTKYGKSD